jgi:ubiquinone/menaquinone biosynthesis C-methylase UbiE
MLEICCGDGFNARHFYSSAASSIIALDFDKDAIPHAKRFNSAPNITYVQQDIRDGLERAIRDGSFDKLFQQYFGQSNESLVIVRVLCQNDFIVIPRDDRISS